MSRLPDSIRADMRWNRYVSRHCECDEDVEQCTVHEITRDRKLVERLKFLRYLRERLLAEEYRPTSRVS